jgi:hypothetical protein
VSARANPAMRREAAIGIRSKFLACDLLRSLAWSLLVC